MWTRLALSSLYLACVSAGIAVALRAAVWVVSEPTHVPLFGTFAFLAIVGTIVLGVFTLPAAPLWILGSDPSRLRRALTLTGLYVLLVVVYFTLGSLDSPERAIRRVTPIIGAIERYEREHGVPPTRLDVLVPAYLPVLPKTACPGFPYVRYSLGRDSTERRWELEIDCRSTLFGFEGLSYDPERSYPSDWGGAHRIGDWVHWND